MPETMIQFTCPVCGVTIPIPQATEPNSDGLTVTWDDSFALEHAIMHADCTCTWQRNTAGTGMVILDVETTCRFHGAGA